MPFAMAYLLFHFGVEQQICPAMIRNYLKIALRNMAKYKGYTFINTLGLTIGIGVCLLILMWAKDELNYDRFHTNSDRIHRALWEARFGDNEWKLPLVPVPLAPTLEREFPEVEKVTQLYQGGFTFKKEQELIREKQVLFVDEAFFEVFTVNFKAGDSKTALQGPNGLVITEETAKRYFGEQDAMGKTLVQNNGELWKVTGVVNSFPDQSHMNFDFLASLKNLPHIERRKEQWSSAAVYTYFLLQPGASADVLQTKLKSYVAQNIAGEESKQGNNYTSFPFQALEDIHLHSQLEYELGTNGNIAYVYIFVIIAIIILLLACINFVNLSTARAMTRAKEVGVRKVLGSQRYQISQQFFAETLLQVVIAVLGAILLVEVGLPYFNHFAGKNLALNIFKSPFVWLLLSGLTLSTTLLAGLFPAIYLSSFMPVKVLKQQFMKVKGQNWLRQGLVIAQFSISACLIIGTLVVKHQLHFLQNQRLGFDKEQVLILNRTFALGNQFNTFIEQLHALPEVEKVTAANNLPGKEYDSTIFLPEQPANYKETSLTYSFVDANYVETLDLEMTQGRNFSPDLSTDSVGCLINQAAAERLGWANPIGKQLHMAGRPKGNVIGVVKDFHFRSMHNAVEPLVLMLGSWRLQHIAIRLKSNDLAKSIANIQGMWKDFKVNTPFEYTFLDEDYQKLYEGEQRMGQVFIVFSILAILIACLGLFGLASFLATQRIKEIGIRKILGASVQGIVGLLSKDFLKLVGIALLIASPIAWYLMNQWLQDFAYRIDLQWWHFGVAGLLAIIIAFVSVSFQSIKAAIANPVEALKYE